MGLQDVKFLQGNSESLITKTSLNLGTFYVGNTAPVLAVGGQKYYGQPTIVYKDNKIQLYGVKGADADAHKVLLGEVDLTLHSMVEESKFCTSKTDAEGKFPTADKDAVDAAYDEAFGADYTGDTSCVVMKIHIEASSGDTHNYVVLPIGKILGNTTTEIDKVETAVGLSETGEYVPSSQATYVKNATSVKDAIEKLDAAIKTATGEVKVTSPLSSITVTGGRQIDVNNDVVTIKQYKDADTNGFSKAGITENELYAADAVIEKGFKVLGGNVGQLKSGDEIANGTTVVELLKRMLVKEADCTAVNPTCTLKISPTTTPVEVGTVVTETLTSTYTDGKFTGSSEDYGSDYILSASCTQGTVTYKRGTTTVTSPDEYTMPEGTTTWSCTSTYEASTATPKKNNGSVSSKTIAAGTTEKSSQSINAYYKWYLGNTTAASVADIVLTGADANVSGVVTGWTSANTVTMKDTWSSNGKSIFVLVKGTLSSFKDNLTGSSLIPNFVSEDKTIEIGGTSTATYKCYLWSITTGSVIAANEIKMTK